MTRLQQVCEFAGVKRHQLPNASMLVVVWDQQQGFKGAPQVRIAVGSIVQQHARFTTGNVPLLQGASARMVSIVAIWLGLGLCWSAWLPASRTCSCPVQVSGRLAQL